ncbi:MAG TPA: hypothetical protein PKJ14_03700 [Candidatus Cloacimonadota bacterium]|nr:hypothetical protein [Candidatus Cloacimonadota bacterium]HQL15550.1 hypothetical protein [Candidatus Cloacimonadota bacterium]
MLKTHDRFVNLKLIEYISRPQYNHGCSFAALTGVFNYLYAEQIGLIPAKDLASALNKQVDLIGTRGNVPENEDVMDWFDKLTRYYHVKGYSSVYFSKANTSKRASIFLEIKQLLKRRDYAFIYNLSNHYNLVIGYFEHAKIPEEAYKIETENGKPIEIDRWLILGDHSKHFDPIWSRDWEEIIKDVENNPPHCIMAFVKE